MALVLRDAFPDVQFTKLLSMCVIHDLGEAISGDLPAPEQARRRAQDPSASKSAAEREDLLTLLAPLPYPTRVEVRPETRVVVMSGAPESPAPGDWPTTEILVTTARKLDRALDGLGLDIEEANRPVDRAPVRL